MEVLITLIIVALAAVCNAVMDVLQFHFKQSVFAEYDEQFFNPAISWRNKYVNHDPVFGLKKIFGLIPVPAAFTDAWHLAKSLMIGLLLTAIVMYGYLVNQQTFAGLIDDFLWLSLTWNIVFLTFYKKILRRK
jgi:hypothetical protein